MRTLVLFVALLAPVVTACVDSEPDQLELDPDASAKADGTTWYKVYTCNNGQAVLDVNSNERRNLQLVIRDTNIMGYFQSRGVVSLPFGATEMVVSGWTGYVDVGRAHGPLVHGQPYGGPGVFNRGDFHEVIANFNFFDPKSPFARILKDGNGIKIQFAQIEGRGCAQTETYCPGDGFECQTTCVDEYTELVERANWYFNNCY